MRQHTIIDIRAIHPCYDPVTGEDNDGQVIHPGGFLPEGWQGTLSDILDITECPAKDRLWVVLGLMDDRQRRLAACAFVRRTPLGDGRTGRTVWDLLDERTRAVVYVAERFATGETTDAALAAALGAARAAARDAARDAAWAASAAARAAAWAAARDAAWAARDAASAAAWAAATDAALAAALGAARDAARDAAWAARDAARAAAWAASAAARAAAWAAARDASAAARAAQIEILREFC